MVTNHIHGFPFTHTLSLQLTDWEKDPGKYCTQFWPGWDAKLTPEIKTRFKINDISKLINTESGLDFYQSGVREACACLVLRLLLDLKSNVMITTSCIR